MRNIIATILMIRRNGLKFLTLLPTVIPSTISVRFSETFRSGSRVAGFLEEENHCVADTS